MDTSTKIKVVMFPWLGHGHISPFLELAKKLSTQNFHIYICSTPINLHSIKNKMDKYTSDIELIEFTLQSSPQLPPQHHTTNGLPPHLMNTLTKAFESASPKFLEIVKCVRPDLIIYDINQPWVPTLAAAYQIPAVNFITAGATTVSYMYRLVKHLQTPFPSTGVYIKYSELMKMSKTHGQDSENTDRIFDCITNTKDILLIKSSREIEGKYLDCLSDMIDKKIVPVGPLVQDVHVTDQENDKVDTIEWLNKKETSSTVYVSFGTESYLTKKEVEELAYGLELSNVNFVWVLKFPEGEKTRALEVLPEGFLERAGDKGRVVEGWAPQARILRHSSIGGFVSHCGWSSVMESLSFGVPIIAIPLQNDQPLNARLVVELGFGMEVEKDEKVEFGREEVARVVRQVVMEKNGENMRAKAQQLSKDMKVKGEEETDSAIMQVKTLVHNRLK